MPRKRPSVDDTRTQKAREELILGPSAVDLDVHDFSVRVAGLPLFRRTEDGNLSQALRLVVLADSAVGDVTFTVSDGDTTLDTARPGSTGAAPSCISSSPRFTSPARSASGSKPVAGSRSRQGWRSFPSANGRSSSSTIRTSTSATRTPRARCYSTTCSILTRSWIWPRPPTTGPRTRSSVGTWKPTGHSSTG